VCVFMYVCVCVCMGVCMYVCLCVCVCDCDCDLVSAVATVTGFPSSISLQSFCTHSPKYEWIYRYVYV